MKKNIAMSVFEIVGSKLCVASSDGQKINDRLAVALKDGHSVTLSFQHITMLTSAFLNAAIGQLYGQFTSEQIRALLDVEDMQPDDLALLKRVVDTAKLYFSDPKKFDQRISDVLEEDGDGEQSSKHREL